MIFGLFIAADHDDISDGFASSTPGRTTRDCSDIPNNVLVLQIKGEITPDRSNIRVIYTFSDSSEGVRTPALVVYRGERVSGCPPTIQRLFDTRTHE